MTKQEKLKAALGIMSGRKKPVMSAPQDLRTMLIELGMAEEEIYTIINSNATIDPILKLVEDIIFDYLVSGKKGRN